MSKVVQPLSVYKIYGREEKQKGAMLKDARKARLKFNKYFIERKKGVGSLWSIPDIVGFTVVVAYPSDISPVASAIDELVDGKNLLVRRMPASMIKHRTVSKRSMGARWPRKATSLVTITCDCPVLGARIERTGQSARFKSRLYCTTPGVRKRMI